MDWDYCLKNFIKRVEIDTEKIESIKETVERRIKYLRSIKVDENNVSFIVEGFYEVIKELLIALLLSRGLRSKNHQCLISYFYKNYPNYEGETNLIARMSYLRNRLDYYGEIIDFGFYDKNKEEINKIINILKNLIIEKKGIY